jgi:hypothetical protein
MASRREQIMEAIRAKLATISGVSTYRSRLTAFSRAESPAIGLRWEKDDVTKRNNDLSERELVVVIDVIARGAVPDSIADQYCVSAHAKLMEDETLGGLTLFTRPIGDVCEMPQDTDLDAVVVVMRYLISYRTTAKTLN